MNPGTRYRYVDFAAAGQPGFRNHLVRMREVPPLVEKYGAVECYASIFCFPDDALLYMEENQVDGRPSIAGYDGRVSAAFLPLDIDAHPPSTLDEALELARATYRLIVERWQVDAAAIHAYFSGAKGFHLLLDARAFGRIVPSTVLPRIFSRLRLQILRALPERARLLFDLGIGDKARLLRLPNTRHGRSKLYKVPLDAAELLGAGADEIRGLARAPRSLKRVEAAGLLPREPVAAAPRLTELFRGARRTVRRQRGPHPYRMGPPRAEPESALCEARRVMWESHVPPGKRNNVAIRLASAFRLAGHTREQTLELLLEWNRERRIGLPEREVSAVIHSAYARPYPYMYGCHDEVIRSFCPYAGRLHECEDYRAQHPRSQRAE